MREDKRFEIVEKEGFGISKETIILRDTQTGVQYLFFQSGYAGGLSPLLDKDGKPIIDKYGNGN